MTNRKKYSKLPKDVKKNDVFRLKMGKPYITVTVKNVKQKTSHSAKVVAYQHETVKLG